MLSYLLASGFLGLGIAIDVALASLGVSALLHSPRQRRIWIGGVSATHVLFPMVGYYGFAAAYRALPSLQVALGVSAAVLVAVFLVSEFRASLEPDDDDTPTGITLVFILAVSWDALWSGPAKSAQAVAWTDEQVFWSFMIAGSVVSAIAALATYASQKVHRWLANADDRSRAATWQVAALWLEFSIIAYFGCLSLVRYVFEAPWTWIETGLLSGGLCGVFFFIFRRQLVAASKVNLENSSGNTR